jgi:hypothetical protein
MQSSPDDWRDNPYYAYAPEIKTWATKAVFQIDWNPVPANLDQEEARLEREIEAATGYYNSRPSIARGAEFETILARERQRLEVFRWGSPKTQYDRLEQLRSQADYAHRMKLLRTPLKELPHGCDRRIVAEIRGERRQLPEPAPTRPLPPLPPCSPVSRGPIEEPLDRFLNGLKKGDHKAISPLEAWTFRSERARKTYGFEVAIDDTGHDLTGGDVGSEAAKVVRLPPRLIPSPPCMSWKFEDVFETNDERVHAARQQVDEENTSPTRNRKTDKKQITRRYAILQKYSEFSPDRIDRDPQWETWYKAVQRYFALERADRIAHELFPGGLPVPFDATATQLLEGRLASAAGLRSAGAMLITRLKRLVDQRQD